ncbi:Na+/H+ antiporter [Frateuria defendens]|uniref:Na+/H+ antiporter n=1 Tax=Frateuria defendens TaxID=2219559 RepID=UPI00066FFA7B|nr:Na+/H+ antiporter [Frateuria defendens]
MDLVFTILILLLVVALSGVVLRLLPFKLPLPLVQIGLGALMGAPPFGMKVQFDHELFFLLFIPPLLFADGWRIPKREFFLLRAPILTLALGLVFFTVVGIGYFVHWMIPVVPLAVAFALASVLSPTDAVAVGSITGGSRLPPRLLHILEGEALMNDASGLVSLQFAVAAALTGTFSLGDAALKFVLIAVGGLGIGFAVTWLFSRVRRRLVRWSGDMDPASQVALLLLLPFAAYLLAEHLHVSGILAAVAAGMTMNYTDILKGHHAATRMQNNSVWNMLEFVFNGMIFLLLGLQLPGIVGDARLDLDQAGGGELWYLAGYVLAITLALVLLRFAWVWISIQCSGLLARLRNKPWQKVRVRIVWVTALSGVRGAITLAGVLSLPLVLENGSAFPARDLMIFLAAGVILCTLLAGSVGLPLLLKKLELPAEGQRVQEERLARELTAQSALKALDLRADELAQHEDPAYGALALRVSTRVIADYQQRVEAAGEEGELPEQARQDARIERDLRLTALRAERDELYRLRRERRIDDQVMRALMRELDLAEASLTATGGSVH